MSFRGEGRRKPHNPFLRVQEKGSFVHSCRAVLIAAPASGQGKTTVTAALARQVRARGACVRVFKTGPDFLDPTILEKASGAPAYQLDLFMGGEAHCRRLLAEAARAADLILVEGVMGLFDGNPSSADLAQCFGLPVLVFFSPLNDATLPDCDSAWLPGGYPELHATKIAANSSMRAALQAHQARGKPLLAECGGMMSLFDVMELSDGTVHAGFGLLPGSTRMHKQFVALGLQAVSLPEGDLRGHSFHCSTCTTTLAPIARGTNPNAGPTEEAVYRAGRLTASYIHLYFPSNPTAIANVLSLWPEP